MRYNLRRVDFVKDTSGYIINMMMTDLKSQIFITSSRSSTCGELTQINTAFDGDLMLKH
jgi:hypothetical protein